MKFKTAVLFDIENLLKGYSFSPQLIANLSLGDIINSIKSVHDLDGISVQKAYANWSDPRLSVMRGEINELGIDPIQVFGFSREQKKNAADIQLAIDAIDLAYTRPAIDTYVIVSGDGGFAALAKKLHEHGKTVIGCGYRSATNNVFRAVCDGFVWINDPEQDIEYEQKGSDLSRQAPSKNILLQVTDPRNVRMTKQISRVSDFSRETVFNKTREIINWYAKDEVCKRDMLRTGLFLSAVQEGIKYAVPGFAQSRMGFPKFVEYMQYVCNGTELCIARPPGLGAVLAMRGKTYKDWEVLPDIAERETHSIENYQSILASGSPVFRLPEESAIFSVAEWVSKNVRSKETFSNILDSLSVDHPSVSSESIKNALICFLSAGIFTRNSDSLPLHEQQLGLRQDLTDEKLVLQQLFMGIESKIRESVGEVKQDVLEKLLSPSLFS